MLYIGKNNHLMICALTTKIAGKLMNKIEHVIEHIDGEIKEHADMLLNSNDPNFDLKTIYAMVVLEKLKNDIIRK